MVSLVGAPVQSKSASDFTGSFAKEQLIRGHCIFDTKTQKILGEAKLIQAENESEELKLDVLIDGMFFTQIQTDNHLFQLSVQQMKLSNSSRINLQTSDKKLDIPGSPLIISRQETEQKDNLKILKIDPSNISSILSRQGRIPHIEHLVIDTNDTCNADCIYCPNPRSSNKISIKDFSKLINHTLQKVEIFQFGCGQEPTLDPRLPQLFELLKNSSLHPQKICMITNATRINTKLLEKLTNNGLEELQVSIDTVDEKINAITRQNTDINAIKKALLETSQMLPRLHITFSTVINALSIFTADKLLDFGGSLGVKSYLFREVWDFLDDKDPMRNDDYKEWIKKISLLPGKFLELKKDLSNHPEYSKIQFFPATSQKDAKAIVKESEAKTL